MEELVSIGLALALCFVALALLVRRPRHPVSLVVALMAVSSVLNISPLSGRFSNPLWGLSVLPLSMLLVVFPDGPRGRGWRRVFAFQVGALVLATIGAAAWPDGQAPATVVVAVGVLAASFVPIAVAAVVSLVRLRRRSVGGRRARIGFVLAAGMLLLLPYLVLLPASLALEAVGVPPAPLRAVADSLFGLTFGAVPVAIAVSALMEPGGRRIPAVERAWRWGLVAAGGLVLGGTVSLLVEASTALTSPRPGTVAAAFVVIALGSAAGVTWARRAAERVPATGERTRVGLADLAQRLSLAPTADEVPGLVAQTLGEALELRGAAVVMTLTDGDERLATWGELDGDVGAQVTRLLTHGGVVVGRIVLAPHRDGVPIDLAALDALAAPVAAPVAAERLTRELQRARDRVLQIRDDERARLRADLHDELSPSLAGLRFAATAARDRLAGGNAVGADALLARVDSEAARAARVVRGILEDLRPDDLARGGLLEALRDRAAALDRPATFTVTVEAPSPLPALAPQTEVAVYRTAVEAMANAARHARGRRCTVRLTYDDRHLQLKVADDGLGLPSQPRPGLGLASMAARTESAGGELQILPGEAGGTLVLARFPLGVPAPAEVA